MNAIQPSGDTGAEGNREPKRKLVAVVIEKLFDTTADPTNVERLAEPGRHVRGAGDHRVHRA